MNELKMHLKDVLQRQLAELGQAHVLRHWDRLNDQQQAKLASQIAEIDFQGLQALLAKKDSDDLWGELAARADVPSAITLDDFADPESSQEAYELGRRALEAGEVGMILVAGGQGSRLGFDHPKGMFPIGPVSNRSLFQIHFEQVLARSRQFETRIPIYVMTSPLSHAETVEFLNSRNFFGMPTDDVFIFCQGTMPAVDQNGKLLLADYGQIFVSPNGHGGMLDAFHHHGCLTDVSNRGIQHLFYAQVDNPLVQTCDPTLIGFHLKHESEMTTQVVRKQDPLQRVGNVVEVDGRVRIIEYSDLPESYARQTNEDGSLKLWAGSIAVHVFKTEFLQRCAADENSLPFHRANKKVPFVDDSGETISPEQPNATKFEKFIFDLLPSANHAIVCEVDPADGFCAVKNAAPAPSETPDHVKAAISDLHTRWLRDAGVHVEPGITVELSPFFAPDGPTLASQVDRAFSITESKFIEGVDDFEIGESPRSTLYATIMAGGAGTRFWPASRRSTPKQLLNLAGDRSMIQSTVDRLQGLCDQEHLLVVTNQTLIEAIAEQLPDLDRDSIIGEPAKRDTAPCIGLAAALIAAKDPEAIMAVMPSDHVIQPSDSFCQAIDYGATLVDQDPSRIVTFGIKPTYPAEVFGYIERVGESIGEQGPATFHVNRFREKPDAETAKQFLEAGSFYWNAGIFVWKAKTILDLLRRFEPEMFGHLQRIAESIGTESFGATLQSEFTAIDGKSIDFAVMEHYDNVLVVEAPFKWDDLGNWSAVPRLVGSDENGNTVQGDHLGLDTQDTIVRTENGHLIVTIGMKDCIVVHTENATLVADRKDENAIKQIVAELEKRDWQQYL